MVSVLLVTEMRFHIVTCRKPTRLMLIFKLLGSILKFVPCTGDTLHRWCEIWHEEEKLTFGSLRHTIFQAHLCRPCRGWCGTRKLEILLNLGIYMHHTGISPAHFVHGLSMFLSWWDVLSVPQIFSA